MNLLIPTRLFALIAVDFLNDFFNIFSHDVTRPVIMINVTRDWTRPSPDDTNDHSLMPGPGGAHSDQRWEQVLTLVMRFLGPS